MWEVRWKAVEDVDGNEISEVWEAVPDQDMWEGNVNVLFEGDGAEDLAYEYVGWKNRMELSNE